MDDYHPRKASAECLLLLTKVCEVERKFMDSLTDAQKKEYLQVEYIKAELGILEQNDLAEYLFENFKKHL